MYMNKTVFWATCRSLPGEDIPNQQKEYYIDVVNMSRAKDEDFIAIETSLLICSDDQ